MIKICFLGIAIGSASLSLTLMVMSGFEKEISQKARGMNSQVVISSKSGKSLAWPEMANLIERGKTDVAFVSATSISQIVVDHGQNFYTLVLKAVDARSFNQVSDLDRRITPNLSETGPQGVNRQCRKIDLQRILTGNNIIIGHKIARTMGIKFGDELKVLLPEPIGKKKIKLFESKVKVVGFLDVGFNEYDSATMICSLDLFWEFFGHKGLVDNVLVKFVEQKSEENFKHGYFEKFLNYLNNILPWAQDKEAQQAELLRQKLSNFKVQLWKELYPALVSSMKLEKYAMFLVLLLVSIVAIMNMISLLIVQVQAKRRDVAILRAMGFSIWQVQKIFVCLGLVLTFFASISGVGFAFAVGKLFSELWPIRLPDAYLVSHLPFDFSPEHFLLIFFATMIIGFFASWIPARQVFKLKIAQVLRGH